MFKPRDIIRFTQGNSQRVRKKVFRDVTEGIKLKHNHVLVCLSESCQVDFHQQWWLLNGVHHQ